jgi:hypothetical protein
MAIPQSLRDRVSLRAGNRCEYCGLSQVGQEATFHVDHIVPVANHGPTEEGNLALACVSCSLKKGARQWVKEPGSEKLVRLFHPRLDAWSEHFQWQESELQGINSCGRATFHTLDLNRPLILAIRDEEAHWGRHPPEFQARAKSDGSNPEGLIIPWVS